MIILSWEQSLEKFWDFTSDSIGELRRELQVKQEEVDAVAIFNTETPENIIKYLNPDILIKGGDYNKADIVGSKFVIENGGSVEVIDLLPGFSTTKIINERIKWL